MLEFQDQLTQEVETPYQIWIQRKGSNSVYIARSIDPLKRELEWIFPLKGNDEPIVLQHFYTETKCLVMDWRGHLWALDVEKKKLIFERDFEARLSCRACISRCGQQLYVSHQFEPRGGSFRCFDTKLTALSLVDFSELCTWNLPEDVDEEYFCERKDGKLLYYSASDSRWCDSALSKGYWHAFDVLDLEDGSCTHHELPSPPRTTFDRKGPWYDLENDRCALVNWDDIECQRAEDGTARFLMRFNIIDLHSFEVVHSPVVREFHTAHLTCFESKDQEVADLLLGDARGEHYDEAMNDMLEYTNTVSFCDTDAMWICWRAGVVRKMAVDGSWRSPLFAAATGDRSNCTEAFSMRCTHTHLLSAHADHVLLVEHGERHRITFTAEQLVATDEFIPVHLESKGLPELETITPRGFKRQMEEMGKVVISVANLTEEASILDALEQMIVVTQDIGAIRNGHELIFLIRDKKGKKRYDHNFFKEAIKVPRAAEKIAELLDNFIRYPDAESLYIHAEATALCYAMDELVGHDGRYIDLALRYLSVIDEEHDVFCAETLVPHMLSEYGDKQEGPRLRLGLFMVWGYRDPDTYIVDVFRDLKSPFRKWFDQGGKFEVRGIIESLSDQGVRLQEMELDDADLVELRTAYNGELQEGADMTTLHAEATPIDPDWLGWNYLQQLPNPAAGKMLGEMDLSDFDKQHIQMFAFCGIAMMLKLKPEVWEILEIGHPRAKQLLPSQAAFESFAGLCHQVAGEDFVRFPGIKWGMHAFGVAYFLSTQMHPADVEVLRRESWNMSASDLTMNVLELYPDAIERVLYFMQPPYHRDDSAAWSAWFACMSFAHRDLPLGVLKQLRGFSNKLKRKRSKFPFIDNHAFDDFCEKLTETINERKGEDEAEPDFTDFVHMTNLGPVQPE